MLRCPKLSYNIVNISRGISWYGTFLFYSGLISSSHPTLPCNELTVKQIKRTTHLSDRDTRRGSPSCVWCCAATSCRWSCSCRCRSGGAACTPRVRPPTRHHPDCPREGIQVFFSEFPQYSQCLWYSKNKKLCSIFATIWHSSKWLEDRSDLTRSEHFQFLKTLFTLLDTGHWLECLRFGGGSETELVRRPLGHLLLLPAGQHQLISSHGDLTRL